MPHAPEARATTFVVTGDPAEAQVMLAGLIAERPIEMSVIASNVAGCIADPGRFENPRWWAGTDARGRVVAGMMQTPPFPLHIGMSTSDDARTLANLLAGQGDSLPGVGGQREPAEAFRDMWLSVTGASAETEMEFGVFDLPTRASLPFAVTGRFRAAEPGEVDLVDGWARDFSSEADRVQRKTPSLAHHVADGRVGLWLDVLDGVEQPVSMAYASVASGGVTRISGVWTPPALRGNGYASAVVTAVSNQRVEAGERCMLFTDLANSTSNKIYQALGYRRIGENITIAFS